MPESFFLFEKRVERISIGAELTKMFGGSTRRKLFLTTTLSVANDADPLQISHSGRVALGQSIWINRKREQ